MADEKYKLRLKNAGRNDTCPCGSGKKYKKCHLQADEKSYSAALAKAREEAAAEAAEAEGDEPEDKKEGQAHLPEVKRHKYAPKTPRDKPTAGSRQISTPRKVGTS
jgi:septal ring factor EnvC (AmiA/AmiB activator)